MSFRRTFAILFALFGFLSNVSKAQTSAELCALPTTGVPVIPVNYTTTQTQSSGYFLIPVPEGVSFMLNDYLILCSQTGTTETWFRGWHRAIGETPEWSLFGCTSEGIRTVTGTVRNFRRINGEPTLYRIFQLDLKFGTPGISSILPASIPCAPGSEVTITGTNFGRNPKSVSVTFGGRAAIVRSVANNTIQVVSPRGLSGPAEVLVTVNGLTSTPSTITYDAPEIVTSWPGALTFPVPSGQQLSLVGKNFGDTSTVTIGGVPATTTLVSNSSIRLIVPTSLSAGTHDIIVTHNGVTSAATPIAVQAGTYRVSPHLLPTVGGVPVTITGAFPAGTPTATIGGIPAPVVSATTGEVVLTAPVGAGAGLAISLNYGGPNVDIPNAIGYRSATLGAISPQGLPTSGGSTVVIAGQNLGMSGAAVTIGGASASIVNQSHSSIVATLPAGSGQNLPVVVKINDLQATQTLTYSYASPVLDTLAPSTGLSTEGGTEVTISGGNLGIGAAMVRVGDRLAPTTLRTHNLLKFLVPPGTGLNNPVSVVLEGEETTSTLTISYAAPTVSDLFLVDSGDFSQPVSGDIVTSGSQLLTITGTGFGYDPGKVQVTVGGSPVFLASMTTDTLTFFSPIGTGTNRPVAVAVDGQSATGSVSFSYAPPTVLGLSPASSPTDGGTTMTIHGKNFGANGASVSVGGVPATVIDQTHTSIRFLAPAGVGMNKTLAVTVGGQTGSASIFHYAGPVVSAISPDHDATVGGATATIYGSNFGMTGGSVTIGGANASIITQTHGWITVSIPAGVGANLPVAVSVGGQTGSANLFSYNAPVVMNISPTHGATVGGASATIAGSNFGPSGATVTIGGVDAPVSAQTQFSITCTIPAGVGANLPVAVSVGGQTGSATLFSYNAPVIGSLSISSAPATGGASILVVGSNFGPNPTLRFGNVAATTNTTGHGAITASVPAVATTYTVPVTVVAGNQVSNAQTFTYTPVADQPATLTFDTGTTSTRTFDFGGNELTVSLASVTTTGTLTVSIEQGNVAPTGYSASRLANLRFVITAGGGIAFTNATLVFHYDESLLGGLDETQLTLVLRDEGGTVTEYIGVVDTVANTVTVTGVDHFSEWYIGQPNNSAVPEWSLLD